MLVQLGAHRSNTFVARQIFAAAASVEEALSHVVVVLVPENAISSFKIESTRLARQPETGQGQLQSERNMALTLQR